MRYKEDYEQAGVPMLPVVRSAKVVGVQIILYSWALVAATLLLIPIGQMGVVYSATAIVSGLWFLGESYRLYKKSIHDAVDNPMRLFHGSISYLTVLFVAIALDPLFFFNFF